MPHATPSIPLPAIEVSPDELIDAVRRAGESSAPPVAEDEETPITTPSGLLKTEPAGEPTAAREERGANLRRAMILIAVMVASVAVVSFFIMGR